ncbi:hypothetical protein QQS45_01630 [Alteriqipengyuania flavescens]|uniref:hypothetical protein n=1 Tax=Alteriqipengyuania flavescens TaxID=3053610 RepID=UPI0025B2B5FE|nr:hypothetical protein [Alteriqipengyuania flavescens]WJY18976.1 hypothetical protein QQW98_01630 [Alteriqipengyuania flavescens]WJY24916.1 hypothetical protein QQS45_01630 [Alteriqipengyuania flavescens]
MVTVDDKADLDIELISALYRAAGERDAFDELITTLKARYVDVHGRDEETRPAVVDQLHRIDQFLPHSIESWRDELERAVEDVPSAAIVFDTAGNVMVANRDGEELFGTKPGRRVGLDIVDPAYRSALRDFFADARKGINHRRMIVRLDTEELARRKISVRAMELCEAVIVEDSRRNYPCIALRVLDIPWTEDLEAQLDEAFALTEAERGIAREFYELRGSARVAVARGTSPATVRTQIKSIFGKTSTTNQAGLLHLLSLLAARAAKWRLGPIR